MSWSAGLIASAISAIIALAGTILGAALAYLFQNRASERAEASALQRELRAERMTVYSSYVTALTEFRRGQTDWYNRRAEDPGSGATQGQPSRLVSSPTALRGQRELSSHKYVSSRATRRWWLLRSAHSS